MFFSIVIPVFNSCNYLRMCLDSIVIQSFHDYEVILVDDGSTDSSLSICNFYANTFDNIKVIHKINAGQVLARIDGVNASVGKYIIFVDSDDWVAPDLLQQLWEIINIHSPDTVVYNFISFSKDLKKDCSANCNPGIYAGENKEHIYNKMIYDFSCKYPEIGIYPAVWTRAVKREIIIKWQSKVDPKLNRGEDLILMVLCFVNSPRIYIFDKVLYNYRVLENSISHRYDQAIFENINILKENFKIIKDITGLNIENQENAYFIKELWACVYKICTTQSMSRAVKLLSATEVSTLTEVFKHVNIKKISLKMRIIFYFASVGNWNIVYLFVLINKIKWRFSRQIISKEKNIQSVKN